MSLGLRNVQKVSVGERNVESCQRLLQGAGFRIHGEHVGLTGPRRVEFNLDSGTVDVQHANRRLSLSA